jgi:hypothetical protein
MAAHGYPHAGQIDQHRSNEATKSNGERDQAFLEAKYSGKDVIWSRSVHKRVQAEAR